MARHPTTTTTTASPRRETPSFCKTSSPNYNPERCRRWRARQRSDEEVRTEALRIQRDNRSAIGARQQGDEDLDLGYLFERSDQREPAIVQTLIFSKRRFRNSAQVRLWVRGHERFSITKGIDETDDSFRVRQRAPGDFKDGSFRTIRITDGVQAVIGRLK